MTRQRLGRRSSLDELPRTAEAARYGHLGRRAPEAVGSKCCTKELQEMSGLGGGGQIWKSGPEGAGGG